MIPIHCDTEIVCYASVMSAHTHTPSERGGWSALPNQILSDWVSDAADSCTHHSFYEYITFYVDPNTNLSSSENQTGHTFTHWIPEREKMKL